MKSHKEDSAMRTTSTVLAGAVLLIAALATAPAAHAGRGWLNVKNCSDLDLTFRLYDWNDSVAASPRSEMYLEPGETGQQSCRKSWWIEDAPGCKADVLYCRTDNTNCNDHDHGRLYSGDYTIWAEEGLDGYMVHYIRSGIASDCNDNNPNQFTLIGDEIDGCTPELVIYGSPDKSGESYVIKDLDRKSVV